MTYHARIAEDGRLTLPDALAHALGLKPGDAVSIERRGDALLLVRDEPDAAIARLRSALKGYSVDQFLAERRADWAE